MATVNDGLTVELTHHAGLVLVDLRGELTAEEPRTVLDAVDEALEKQPRQLQIGMRQVTFVDSWGLRVLVRVRDRVILSEAALQLVGPGPQVRRLLEVTGLDTTFDIVE